jgi:hypothetical protein
MQKHELSQPRYSTSQPRFERKLPERVSILSASVSLWAKRELDTDIRHRIVGQGEDQGKVGLQIVTITPHVSYGVMVPH